MIVGFVGFMGSGKGTAGDILANDFGFKKESFAGALKDVTALMFGWPRVMLEGDTEESRQWREQPEWFWSRKFGRDFTPREALQLIGTEVGRNIFHEDFWVMSLENRLRNGDYVITDVRFPNEIDWIKKQGGVVIEVGRGEKPSWYNTALRANKIPHTEYDQEIYALQDEVHNSEWAWIGSDMNSSIQNDGTVADLKKSIIRALTVCFGESKMNELLHNGVLNETI